MLRTGPLAGLLRLAPIRGRLELVLCCRSARRLEARPQRMFSKSRVLNSKHGWPKRTGVVLGALALAGGTAVAWSARTQRTSALTQIGDDKETASEAAVESHDTAVDNSLLGFLRRLKNGALLVFRVAVVDGVLEVLLTIVRCGELFLYFAPLALTYPAVWFGAHDADRDNERAGALWWYWFLRRQMSRAGPTFVKLSQWAASRTDLFAAQLCLELGRLHDCNCAHSAARSKHVIARAFGVSDMSDVFSWFDDRPLGAGAVAQVHRARFSAEFIDRLLATDAPGISSVAEALQRSPEVAVKVLHPGVERLIRRDLRIMRWGACVLGALPGMRWLSLPDEVAIFGEMMESQVDLRVESQNIQRFAANFAARPGVSFPHVARQGLLPLDSPNVLVESFQDGVPLRAFLDTSGHTVFDKDIGSRGLDAFLHMLIYDNFVHADLHPGNIMVELVPPDYGTPLDRFVEDFFDMSPFNRRKHLLQQEPLPTSSEAHAHIRGILGDHESGAITSQQMSDRIHEYTRYLYRNGFTPSLVFLDCGLVTLLDSTNRRNFIDLFEAVCTFDGKRAGHLMIDRCLTPDLVINRDVFVLRIQDIILKVREVSFQLSKLTFSEIFTPVMTAVRTHHVRLAPDFINIIMAMFILEGIGRRLDPDSDILRVALPMLRTWLRDEARNELAAWPQRDAASVSATTWNLYKVWLYVELREYVSRVRYWGGDDSEFFGEFAPFVGTDCSA
ncbi:hypothetical protein GGF44_000972 [Coemansia sp. RSA 1694]|nr:hypothetical protein GGF38_000378 [Coemansia sp. RSA 25]KAJ2643824.1 hypothetical protein GGF44_000972 [Coemansia sp. RSA 1694]